MLILRRLKEQEIEMGKSPVFIILITGFLFFLIAVVMSSIEPVIGALFFCAMFFMVGLGYNSYIENRK